jgi:hypothetical protein
MCDSALETTLLVALFSLLLVQALANMLVEVCKNPKSPGFNHYLFESVAALIKHGTAGQPQQLRQYEGTLFPAFEIVLKNDVQVRRGWGRGGGYGSRRLSCCKLCCCCWCRDTGCTGMATGTEASSAYVLVVAVYQ